MYRIFFIIILLILSSIPMKLSFAEWCNINEELPTNAELTSKIDECIDARSWEWPGPNSITEYTCPQGNAFNDDNQPITHENDNNIEMLAYNIAVNLAFNKADKDIKSYMQKLSKKREPDPTKWIEEIHQCTEKIRSIYDNICSFWTIEKRLNENKEKQYIITTNAYPQKLCRMLAEKKSLGWYYMWTIMMSDGIAKNQKNSTDKWIGTVKGKYARIVDSWHTYQKILTRAVSKMTGYNKQIVK